METRKIQQVSKGTFTVSLPREWARENGLSAGDVVHVHASLDGTLVVQPADDETANIDLAVCDESPEQLTRLLRTAYVLGALRIRVSAEDGFTERQRTALRATVRTLSGMATDEESAAGPTTDHTPARADAAIASARDAPHEATTRRKAVHVRSSPYPEGSRGRRRRRDRDVLHRR